MITWMHTFSPGEDVDRRPRRAAQADAAPAHAGRHGAAVVDHRHGLHEPQPGRPRRPRVRLRPDPARHRPQDRRRPRATRPCVARRTALWARAALGSRTSCARLKLARFGDNMRDVAVTEGDKVEAQLRFGVSVNTYGVNDLVDGRRPGRRRRRRRARRPSTPTRTTSRRSCCPAATGTSRCATARGSRLGLRQFLTEGGFGAFTTNFEDLGGLRQLPGLAVQRLMADGYGFGGEGDWKTSVLLRAAKAMAGGEPGGTLVHGGLHVPPGPGRGEDPRRAHARGLPVDRRAAARPSRSTRSASAAARTPCGCASPPRPARPSSSGSPTSATGSA